MRTTVQRTLAIAGVIGVLAGGVLLGAPAPSAQAVPVVAETSLGGNAPKGIRAWMINVLGSVLGAATPNKWQREQLANANRVNQGWETLDAEFGYNSALPGGENWIPQTTEEYRVKRAELESTGSFTKSNGQKVGSSKPMFAPATKADKLKKVVGGVGGAVTAVTGFSFGTMVGNFGMELFGFDVDGAVCGNTDGAGQTLASLVTGADCTAFNLADEYIPNSDVESGAIVSGLCADETLTPSRSNGSPAPLAPQCSAAIATWRPLTPSGSPSVLSGYVVLTAVTEVAPRQYKLTFDRNPGEASGGFFNMPEAWMGCLNANGTINGTTGHGITLPAGTGEWEVTYYTSCASNSAGFVVAMSGRVPNGTTNPGYEHGWVYVLGQPLVPLEFAAGDPDRTLVCTITGSDSNVYTMESAPYREGDGTIAAPECPTLPEGVTPANVTIDEHSPAGVAEVFNEDTTDEYLDWWETYPECRTGACKLDLKIADTQASCFDLDDQCADWFASPNRATEYTCTYGTHEVDQEECFVYAGVFQPARRAIGAPYSDPLTGDWSGGENALSPDRQAMGQAIQSPVVARSCNGMAAEGFDPVAWVMRPIQCALEWAFVPRPAVIDLATEEVAQEWERTPVAAIGAAVGGWNVTPDADGCAIPVTLPNPFGDPYTFNVLDACEGSWIAPVAAISRVVTSAAFVVLVVVLLRRQFAATVDYKP